MGHCRTCVLKQRCFPTGDGVRGFAGGIATAELLKIPVTIGSATHLFIAWTHTPC